MKTQTSLSEAMRLLMIKQVKTWDKPGLVTSNPSWQTWTWTRISDYFAPKSDIRILQCTWRFVENIYSLRSLFRNYCSCRTCLADLTYFDWCTFEMQSPNGKDLQFKYVLICIEWLTTVPTGCTLGFRYDIVPSIGDSTMTLIAMRLYPALNFGSFLDIRKVVTVLTGYTLLFVILYPALETLPERWFECDYT